MSTTEAKRLMTDLAGRDDLARELAALEHDPAAWHRRVAQLGYELTGEEVEDLLCGGLDDEDLEQVAGGWEGDGTGDDGTGSGTGGGTGGG